MDCTQSQNWNWNKTEQRRQPQRPVVHAVAPWTPRTARTWDKGGGWASGHINSPPSSSNQGRKHLPRTPWMEDHKSRSTSPNLCPQSLSKRRLKVVLVGVALSLVVIAGITVGCIFAMAENGSASETTQEIIHAEMRIDQIYQADLDDQSSAVYKSWSDDFCSRIDRAFEKSSISSLYIACQVTGFRRGSIITEFTTRMKVQRNRNEDLIIMAVKLVLETELSSPAGVFLGYQALELLYIDYIVRTDITSKPVDAVTPGTFKAATEDAGTPTTTTQRGPLTTQVTSRRRTPTAETTSTGGTSTTQTTEPETSTTKTTATGGESTTQTGGTASTTKTTTAGRTSTTPKTATPETSTPQTTATGGTSRTQTTTPKTSTTKTITTGVESTTQTGGTASTTKTTTAGRTSTTQKTATPETSTPQTTATGGTSTTQTTTPETSTTKTTITGGESTTQTGGTASTTKTTTAGGESTTQAGGTASTTQTTSAGEKSTTRNTTTPETPTVPRTTVEGTPTTQTTTIPTLTRTASTEKTTTTETTRAGETSKTQLSTGATQTRTERASTTTSSSRATTTESSSTTTTTTTTTTNEQGESCQLPSCFRPESGIPGGIPRDQTPMLVYFSFDDAISAEANGYFDRLFDESRRNPNGCPIRATHFNSYNYTVYSVAQDLFSKGHEVASHSITHRTPSSWWAEATIEQWRTEIAGQRQVIHEMGGLPLDEIRGMRAPYLQLGGDVQFTMLEEEGFMFDATMSSQTDPPSWPFTLHYPEDLSKGVCSIQPCPTQPHAIWEVPLNVNRMDNLWTPTCAMIDGCRPGNKAEALDFLRGNFERHYTASTKPPFGVNMHAAWFRWPFNLEAMDEFIAELMTKNDVWIVPIHKMLQWVQTPAPLSEMNTFVPFQC